MSLRAVLFDADGVVQETNPEFRARLEALCPEPRRAADFIAEVFAAEKPCATGEEDFAEALDAVMRRWRCTVTLAEALACWECVTPNDGVLEVIRSIRESGTTVALATNQQNYRAAFMRGSLGYAAHFDELLISCEMGAAKPASRYFELATARLGVDPGEALFIDDAPNNVQAAQATGLHALQYHLSEGTTRLREALESYGVPAQVPQ